MAEHPIQGLMKIGMENLKEIAIVCQYHYQIGNT